MITITEKCNLNCRYCFECNKSHRSIPSDIFLNIVVSELEHHNYKYPDVLFDIMGGEPFVEFDMLRDVCEFVWKKDWSRKYKFFATTNGTLIHDNIAKWLYDNRDRFVCGLSLDGTPETHNYNRSNSFNSIDVAFFRKTWPEQHVKMTIYPQGLDTLFENARYIHSLGFIIKANLAYGPDWSDDYYAEVLEVELEKLIEYYEDNSDIVPVSFMNMDILPVSHQSRETIKWCGIGEQMIAYGIDGKKYPCHFLQSMSSNNQFADGLWEVDYEHIEQKLNNRCKECILRNTCPTCYAYNYVKFNDYGYKDPSVCKLIKLMAVATSTLKARCIIKNNKSLLQDLSDREKDELLAIKYIQKANELNDWRKEVICSND